MSDGESAYDAIRGLKILGLLFVIDVYVTLCVRPRRVLNLLLGLFLLPFLVIAMCFRVSQDHMLEYCLENESWADLPKGFLKRVLHFQGRYQ